MCVCVRYIIYDINHLYDGLVQTISNTRSGSAGDILALSHTVLVGAGGFFLAFRRHLPISWPPQKKDARSW